MFEIIFAAISVTLIALVLIQQKSSSLGSMMGADSGDEMVQTRRGADKVLHQATVIVALIFALAGIYAMIF